MILSGELILLSNIQLKSTPFTGQIKHNHTMKKLLITLICCFTVSVGFSQTQAQMNSDANATFQKADKELNVVYQKILKEYKDDPVLLRA